MKRLFAIIVPLLPIIGYSQQPSLNTPVDMVDMTSNIENLIRALSFPSNTETTELNVEGSAYINEEFTDGMVELSNGKKYSGIPLRYNAYNDLIEFRNKAGKIYNINNPAEVRGLTIGQSKFEYVEGKKTGSGFFAEVLTDGNTRLLKHYRLKIQPAKPAQTHQEAQPPRFVKIPSEYLIRRPNGDVKPVRNNKDLLSLLADKNTAIEKLIRSERLSVSEEKDLIRIVNFYNAN